MKLKYYLRGLGMGIIFATIILTISGAIHNNNLSEERIIKEARKLGMIMPEEEDSNKGGLWNSGETTEIESESDSENETETSNIDEIEEQMTETETTEEETTEETKKDGEKVQGEDGITYIVIYVYSGDTARIVSERLYDHKLVDDAEKFRKYLGQTGNAARLSVGEFLIPVGATYEQICEVLMRR